MSVVATPAGLPVARLARAPVPLLVAVGVVLVALCVAGFVLGRTDATAGPVAMTVTIAVAFTPLGVFVVRRLPRNPLGRLMLFAGLVAYLATLAVGWSGLLVAAWLSQWLWWPPLATIPVLLLVVPDGRPPSPRWRPLAAAVLGSGAVVTVALAAAALARPRTLLTVVGQALPGAVRVLVVVAVVGVAVLLVCTLGVLVSLVRRWRAAEAMARGRLACLLPSAALLVVGVLLDALTDLQYTWLLAVAALPVGLTLAVLRYQLHDLDLFVHRGTVWLVLTAFAVATFALVVTGLGTVLAGPGSPTATLIAAAAVAALLQPAQWVAQRAVSRLLYGRRDEPYAVLTELGRHLEAVRDPLAVLPEIATTIVDGLRVPYAAVVVAAHDGTTGVAAEHGRWAGEPERFPMVAHGTPVGELLVAPRRPGTRFTAAETRLLRDLAGQTALAAEACRSAVDLQRARDRLVLAREEERRSLRRDLHDGVASALVGTRMLTTAVRATVPPGGSAPELLDALVTDLDACTAEVRRLIDGLRPAALDEGLGPALRALAARVTASGPAVDVELDGQLDELPAAVEVAAYRVVAEALANVVKHADATTARVRVARDGRHLEVSVTDDGRGLPAHPGEAGVGLSSIHERAEELGGSATVGSGPDGTAVVVLLPVAG